MELWFRFLQITPHSLHSSSPVLMKERFNIMWQLKRFSFPSFDSLRQTGFSSRIKYSDLVIRINMTQKCLCRVKIRYLRINKWSPLRHCCCGTYLDNWINRNSSIWIFCLPSSATWTENDLQWIVANKNIIINSSSIQQGMCVLPCVWPFDMIAIKLLTLG